MADLAKMDQTGVILRGSSLKPQKGHFSPPVGIGETVDFGWFYQERRSNGVPKNGPIFGHFWVRNGSRSVSEMAPKMTPFWTPLFGPLLDPFWDHLTLGSPYGPHMGVSKGGSPKGIWGHGTLYGTLQDTLWDPLPGRDPKMGPFLTPILGPDLAKSGPKSGSGPLKNRVFGPPNRPKMGGFWPDRVVGSWGQI